MVDHTVPARTTTDEPEETSFTLDMILAILRRYWLIIILSALAGGAFAYYFAGRQGYVYQKTASVMMRDSKTDTNASSERIMTELGIDSGATNLANESFILKSTSLMIKVVEDLHTNISYWQKKDFREIDLYKKSPLLAVFEQIEESRSCLLHITPLDEHRFILSYPSSTGDFSRQEGIYGEPVTLPFAVVSIHPTPQMTDDWNGKTVIVRRDSILRTASGQLANLTVTRPDAKDSSLLEMSLTSSNSQKAADVLNHLIQVYNQISKDEKSEAALKTKEFIQGRLKKLGADLSKVDQKITDFKMKSDIFKDTDTTMSADFSTAQALEKEIFDLETQIKLAASLTETLKEAGRKEGLLSVDTGLADPGISKQLEIYNEAYLEYRKIAGSAGSQNPITIGLRDKMNSIRTAAYKSLANYRANLDLKLKELANKRNSLAARLENTATKEQEITPLIREHKVMEELYLTLLSKEQENDLALAIAKPSAKVLETAHGPDAPISPKTIQYIAAGTAGGAVICIFAFMGVGMMNNKLMNKHDLAGISHQPVIGELPGMSKKERKQSTSFIQDEHSIMAECFHILRNNVDSMLPKPTRGGHVIMVTSTMAGEGKTFVSANLAAAFAKAGRRVLLIDGDLRKFSLTHRLGGNGRKGMTNILLNQVDDPSGIIHPLEHPFQNIDVLYSGSTAPNPITLLSHPRLGQMINTLKQQYDAVIIDAPPYGILADTSILASVSDITLYTVRSGKIDKRYFTQIQRLADSGKLPNLGYLVNDVNFKSARYSYYGYGYGYGYHYGYGNKKKEQTEDKIN